MSRIAKSPVTLPAGVDVKVNGTLVTVKGSKATLEQQLNDKVKISIADGVILVTPVVENKDSWAQAGTARALINNMVKGVTEGFEKKLILVGVGYRAKAEGQNLNLTLGFSHPVVQVIPAGVTVETPTQTEILIKGADKQVIGQIASEIRGYRPPEPYKGKGIKYSDEYILRKEAKKK